MQSAKFKAAQAATVQHPNDKPMAHQVGCCNLRTSCLLKTTGNVLGRTSEGKTTRFSFMPSMR